MLAAAVPSTSTPPNPSIRREAPLPSARVQREETGPIDSMSILIIIILQLSLSLSLSMLSASSLLDLDTGKKRKTNPLSLFLLLPGRAARARAPDHIPLLPQLLLSDVRHVEPVRHAHGQRHAEAGVGVGEVRRVEDEQLRFLRRLVKDVRHQEAGVLGAAVFPAMRVRHEGGLPAVAPLPVLERRHHGFGGIPRQEVDFRDAVEERHGRRRVHRRDVGVFALHAGQLLVDAREVSVEVCVHDAARGEARPEVEGDLVQPGVARSRCGRRRRRRRFLLRARRGPDLVEVEVKVLEHAQEQLDFVVALLPRVGDVEEHARVELEPARRVRGTGRRSRVAPLLGRLAVDDAKARLARSVEDEGHLALGSQHVLGLEDQRRVEEDGVLLRDGHVVLHRRVLF